MEVAEREYDELLSNKTPNLSAAGTRTTDLYYSESNSSVSVLESSCDWANVISLTSKDFGSSNQVNLPMSAFVGLIILRLVAPAIAVNQTLCRGWGLRSIKQIRFQFGTSAATPILLNQQAIWHFLFSQCHTEEKRSELLKLCGQEYLTQPPSLADGAEVLIEAHVPLPVPFSAICEKLMYDTTILGQPISVYIDFEQNARCIYGGSATPPTSFISAELMIRQQRLTDQSKSLRNVMIADPSMMYSYPFVMALGYETNGPFLGAKRGAGVVNVQLNQFQNSDLLGIAVSVQKVLDLQPAGTDSPNPFEMDEISNVNLTYNGSALFQYPGTSYKAISTYMGNQEAAFYQVSHISAGATNPFTSVPRNSTLLYFDFTRLRQACIDHEMENTRRVPPGNVLNLSFNTSESGGASPLYYRCFYTCFYNAVVTSQAGVSNVFTS